MPIKTTRPSHREARTESVTCWRATSLGWGLVLSSVAPIVGFGYTHALLFLTVGAHDLKRSPYYAVRCFFQM